MVAKVTIVQGDLDKLLAETRRKVDGVKSLRTPYNREQVAKAIFTIAGKEFIKQTGIQAASGDGKLKHLYEWGKVGSPKSKLFLIHRTRVRGGSLLISTSFLESKKPVPIPEELKTPGPTGRSVKRKHIFKKKAEVMEKNNPVVSWAGWADALAIPTGGYGPLFIRYPRTVTIKHPGGVQAKNGLANQLKKWFKNPTNINLALAKSGYIRSLEFQIARELRANGAGAAKTSSVIKSVSDKYSKGMTTL